MPSNSGSMGGTNTGTNTPNWSDPNYWSAWNNTLGSLGGAIGTWVDAFSDNGQQPIVYQQSPQAQQQNTILYVVLAVMILLVIIILFMLFRKK